MNTIDSIAISVALLLVLVLGIYVVLRGNQGTGDDLRSTDPASSAKQRPGASLYQNQGCHVCHSIDGSKGLGPTFKGLYGSRRTFSNHPDTRATETYLRNSIRHPGKRVVKSYPANMPSYDHLSKKQVNRLIQFIKSLGDADALKPQKNDDS